MNIDDPNLDVPEIEKYSGVTGRTDRIAIVNLNDFISGATHFVAGKGVFSCFGQKDKPGLCDKFGGLPIPYYILTILKYYTIDRDGVQLDTDRARRGDLGVLQFWKVGVRRMSELRKRHKISDLRIHDLVVTCTEAEYQKLDIIVTPQNFWRTNKLVEKKYLDEYEKIKDQASRLLGKTFASPDQFQQWFTGVSSIPDVGSEMGPVPSGAPSGAPSGVLNFEIGAPSAEGTTPIDDILRGMKLD
jgi:hypothetical protein